MKKVKLGFNRLPVPDVILRSRGVVSRMQGNNNFAEAIPSLEDVTAAVNALESAADEAADGSRVKKSLMRKAKRELNELIITLGAYVQTASKGDEHVILSSGFDIQNNRRQAGPVNIPLNIQGKAGQLDGEVHLRWNACSGAKSYVAEVSVDGTNWTSCGISTGCRMNLKGLVSGSKSAFRVAAIGSLGQSGWSDPAMVRIG